MNKKQKPDSGHAAHIGEIIDKLLNSYHLKPKFDEFNLISSWKELVGGSIAKRTKKIFIRNKVLFVELKSPSMKHDMGYLKGSILEKIHDKFGKESIREIILM